MIYEVIKNSLINQLGIDPDLINQQTFIKKDLNLDSTETVILALEIKKHLKADFKFTEQDITLAEICEQINKNPN